MTMHKLTINEILTPKPDARPRIYAYSIADEDHGDPPLAELHRPFLDRCPDIPLVLVRTKLEMLSMKTTLMASVRVCLIDTVKTSLFSPLRQRH